MDFRIPDGFTGGAVEDDDSSIHGGCGTYDRTINVGLDNSPVRVGCGRATYDTRYHISDFTVLSSIRPLGNDPVCITHRVCCWEGCDVSIGTYSSLEPHSLGGLDLAIDETLHKCSSRNPSGIACGIRSSCCTRTSEVSIFEQIFFREIIHIAKTNYRFVESQLLRRGSIIRYVINVCTLDSECKFVRQRSGNIRFS